MKSCFKRNLNIIIFLSLCIFIASGYAISYNSYEISRNELSPDYDINLMQAQRPGIIGTVGMLFVILALVIVLLLKSHKEQKKQKDKVRQRTKELEDKSNAFEYQKVMLQTMINSIPDVIFSKDLDLKYTLLNKFTADYFGVDKDKVIGFDGYLVK